MKRFQQTNLSCRITIAVLMVCAASSWNACLAAITNITQSTTHATIQEAITAATSGDEITVSSGTYTETLDLQGKEITLRSENGPTVTTIDANNANAVITCIEGETENTIIQGFTITGGRKSSGAGAYIRDSSPTFISCIFTGNVATFGGGAMFNYRNEPKLLNCIFTNNEAIIGGAIWNFTNGNPRIINCTFAGNEASDVGGAIFSESSHPVVTNAIFWGNTSVDDAQITNAYGYTAVTFSCVEGGYTGMRNIAADPLFVSPADLHLQQGSPCIDSGNTLAFPHTITTDFEGGARIHQCRIDMGADESLLPGADCNTNGITDECEIDDELIEDCDNNRIPDTCDVADNPEIDCNNNDIPDLCDIADGTSSDCNGNNVPDICDVLDGTTPDCNHNSVPDSCDIAYGTSNDVSPRDGVPDECQTPQPCVGACCLNGACIMATQLACNAAGGYYQGHCTYCCGIDCTFSFSADFNGDGTIDLSDYALFQQSFTGP